jgi:hypothetical protein
LKVGKFLQKKVKRNNGFKKSTFSRKVTIKIFFFFLFFPLYNFEETIAKNDYKVKTWCEKSNLFLTFPSLKKWKVESNFV